MTRKNVLVFRPLPPDQLARLQAVHTVTVADPRQPAERAAFDAALTEAHGLIGSSFPITAEMLARAAQLQVISSISVGVDNYPVQAMHERGITLCHTPGVLDETVADAVFALLMATCRRVPELSQMVREGRWNRNIGEELFGVDVHGKTLGLLGFGRIGQAVARRAALGFGMPVLYHAAAPSIWPHTRLNCATAPSMCRWRNCWPVLTSWWHCCRCRTAHAGWSMPVFLPP